jgi:hypothetical protein
MFPMFLLDTRNSLDLRLLRPSNFLLFLLFFFLGTTCVHIFYLYTRHFVCPPFPSQMQIKKGEKKKKVRRFPIHSAHSIKDLSNHQRLQNRTMGRGKSTKSAIMFKTPPLEGVQVRSNWLTVLRSVGFSDLLLARTPEIVKGMALTRNRKQPCMQDKTRVMTDCMRKVDQR